MANLPPEELSREITRLWARVGAGAGEPAAFPPPEPPTGGSEAAWDTVALLKRQHRQREAAWTRALEAKEEALKVFKERAEALQAEAESLRRRDKDGEERLLEGVLDAQGRLEAAAKEVEREKAGHEAELARLRGLLEETRLALAAEASRARQAEARRESLERQRLADLKEVQALADRRERESGAAGAAARALQEGMSEAKNALEKTLSELLMERRAREGVERERSEAVRKVAELQKHFEELQKIWEEERSQWRELWDRERSTWETQRQELAQWEENLRREREAWHSELQAKEKSHLVFSDDLSRRLRETARAAESVDDRMRAVESREAGDRARMLDFEASAVRRAGRRRRVLAAAAGASLLWGLSSVAWEWGRAWVWSAGPAAAAPGASPSALAFDGRDLWAADWSGTLSLLDLAAPGRIARSLPAPMPPPYHPVALASGGGLLWSLDAAQSRIIRHDGARPEKILAVRASPGPAPAALAFDGESLWSYDAANRSFYRHSGDEGEFKAYPLETDAVPTAMAWLSGRLWAFDSRGGLLLVFERRGERLKLIETLAAPRRPLLALASGGAVGAGGSFYALAGAGGSATAPSWGLWKLRRRWGFTGF